MTPSGESLTVFWIGRSPTTFDVFAGDEPGLSDQIDIFPFGLQQRTYPTQAAQTDPKRELSFFL